MPFGLLFMVSVIAGLVGAMTGIGGGLVLVPVLTFFSGIDIKQAIAVSNLATIVVAISATVGYIRRHMPNLNVSAFLQIFAILGAWLGALITVSLGKRPIFFFYGIFLLFSCSVLWPKRKKSVTIVPQQKRASSPSRWQGSYYDYAEKKTIHYRAERPRLAGLLMFGAGFISGALSIGTTVFTILVHEGIMGLPTKVSLPTSQLIIAVMALISTNVYLERGLINAALVAPVILGVPFGAFVGSKLFISIKNRAARFILLIGVVLLGIQMILRGVWVTR